MVKVIDHGRIDFHLPRFSTLLFRAQLLPARQFWIHRERVRRLGVVCHKTKTFHPFDTRQTYAVIALIEPPFVLVQVLLGCLQRPVR
ncbi:hypothetical protein D3C85_1413170 [compost metagenome]